ncbi:GNAT family N-acetyltransferase [Mangrovitalea sediminis]|uniref:GNAT family N-acetyltransferase n=1 Tax=Mangrovitalea sediminis TaxID=1982043 RepID=UPI000BE54637|nr:GNAT family N-acetyltransferase [Mangrovitalea sediminis]
MSDWIYPVTLRGRRVTLEPLQPEHCEGLQAAAGDGELWRLWYTSVPTPENMAASIEEALEEQAQGVSLPFAVRDNASGKLLGSTRYLHVEASHRRLEIGATWYARSAQRTGINTECKLLLLTHAFEELKAIAVEFRTHWHNRASRAAIARLGARQDGVLRHHYKMADGSFRDTVVFSIVEPEWLAVRRNLQFMLETHE